MSVDSFVKSLGISLVAAEANFSSRLSQHQYALHVVKVFKR